MCVCGLVLFSDGYTHVLSPHAHPPTHTWHSGFSLGTPNLGAIECISVTSTSTITSTGSDPFNDMIALHRGSGSTTPTPRRRAHGRGFILVFLVFTAAVLFLLFLVTILHLSLMRHEAGTRLGHVLGIIESAGTSCPPSLPPSLPCCDCAPSCLSSASVFFLSFCRTLPPQHCI